MRTTRGYRCWRRARARPRQDVCGLTFATTDQRAIRLLRQYGLRTRPIAEANTPSNICGRFKVRCRQMPTQVSISYIKMIGFRRWLAGRTFAASSMTLNRPTPRLWLEKLWNGSQLCMRLRTISVGGPPTNDNKFAKY